MSTDYKSNALVVRKALLDLQKEMLNHLKDQFQRESGREVPPAEWLQVLMMSQRYLWMREMTSLIADVDMLTEIEEMTREQAAVARHEVERMLLKNEDQGDFQKQYKALLLGTPELMLPHGHLKKATHALPTQALTDDEAKENRKNWHEVHRLQARKKRN